ncbi:GIY-YIG nuclease family protein [Streptomyces sp. DH37]|uniref:GIY-YIG nuclease family protein n=1 Tax=Streptomyces sp. DH37 TaxID=3040122 RepID=UPI002441290A|nr:GIY-YIG nuclease family protein [Streptomyces sp. DH37]MDG9701713.1 hypothetical protein [Streptomyces sp. DH37]
MKPRHLPLRPFDPHAVWLEAVTDQERKLQKSAIYGCALYRFYDASRSPLYIGISRNLPDRWNWHRCNTDWQARARYVAVSFYPTRYGAYVAEAAAIRRENPQFNVMRPKPRRGWRAVDESLYIPPPPQLADEG